MPHFPSSDGRPSWRALVLTLFPEAFPGPLGISLAAQAREAGIWSLETMQLREFGLGKHRQVDDTPAGGGAGMVLRADVLGPALDHARAQSPDAPLIYLSPRGTPLTQSLARDLAEGPGVTLLAGRFEGIDERVIAARGLKEVSIGDYVLAGGEVAAMVLIEACVRLLPGVIGAAESLASESFETGLLEYPQYTKPRDWEGRAIPDILLSGDHKKIEAWRQEQSERLTAARRPDLMRARGQKPT
ncbi:MAG TPA: tRNA (guanosine(37)-N1)-methyltransferase TrmD [Hyphomicrobium sp.]|jgi:tRNA (guanine37-N1)-methyltransferase|nr:tRNA (guanosine(37)-N1)-methyltransferase TrmD [Hyphomicrobium sp.]